MTTTYDCAINAKDVSGALTFDPRGNPYALFGVVVASLATVGVTEVTDASIPVIMRRLYDAARGGVYLIVPRRGRPRKDYDITDGGRYRNVTEGEVRKFMGLKVNCMPLTDEEFSAMLGSYAVGN